MHDKVDSANRESRGKIRIEYSMPLRSLKLGVIGKADVVEFHREDKGMWRPYPVEHKRGKSKIDNCDRVQLCAQAMCLEEMIGIDVPNGALFYGRTKRREEVVFNDQLRTETEKTAQTVHDLIESGKTPAPDYSKRCKTCSLLQQCLPDPCSKKQKASRYLIALMKELDAPDNFGAESSEI